jgi:hypothetical protein
VSEKNLEPPKPKRSPVSLPNGTDVMPPDKNKGLGTLTIVNGKNHDAVVQLIDENKPETVYRCVYVKRDDKVTITQIAPGAYQLKFTTGDDWDKETLKFLEYAEYHQFDDSLIFREVSTQTSTEYSRYEVTLHKVAQGNARTAPIDERAFKKVSPQ